MAQIIADPEGMMTAMTLEVGSWPFWAWTGVLRKGLTTVLVDVQL